jgi:hypothetical protein
MNKDYLYKVYNYERQVDYQRVLDGDFEGLFEAQFELDYQSVGTPTRAARSRDDTFEGVLGKGITFDGVNDFMYIPGFNEFSGDTYIASGDFTIGFWFTKTSWAGANEIYIDCKNNIIGNAGLKLSANGTNLVAEVSLSGTYRSCTYALASISAGRHFIAFGSDGRYIRLYIDGVNVATYDNGSDVGCYLDSFFDTRFGCARGGASGFVSGYLEQFSLWSSLLTTDEILSCYQTSNALGNENILYSFDFDTVDVDGWTYSDINNCDILIDGATSSVTDAIYKTRSIKVITSTGGSAEQGIELSSDGICAIVGGRYLTAHAYIKAPVGESIKLVATPYGGGTEQETTLVASGSWEQISLTLLANSLATSVKLKIVITNASASAKTFYFDRVALNDGQEIIPYFTRDTANSNNSVYGYEDGSHIWTHTVETYIKTWNDVISDFKYDQEINTAGSQLTLTLARKAEQTGEGTDLDFDLLVKIYQVDSDNPTGKLVFIGTIADYTVNEEVDNVAVILFGRGAELNNYLVTTGENRVALQPLYNTDLPLQYWSNLVCQTFTLDRAIKLRKLVVRSNGLGILTANVIQGVPGGLLTVIGGQGFHVRPAGNSVIAAGQINSTNTSFGATDIDFDDVTLYPDTPYYLEVFYPQGGYIIDLQSSGASDAGSVSEPFGRMYAGYVAVDNSSASVTTQAANPQIYMEIWENKGSTTVAYNSQDPSDILRSIIDNYQEQGGNLIYDGSIADTGTTVSYTFKAVTTFDALKKCLELAPANWFFYIDQAENKIYFKEKSTTPDHTFVIGKHFSKLTYEKRTDDIVNVIYFTGGDLGGYNLFKVYIDQASIDLYGRKLLTYSDNRVTLIATADTIAQAILEEKANPEVRVPLEVLQNYPIDTIKPGDVVRIRNSKSRPAEISLWDVGYWDEMYWDYNIFNPATYELQIARFSRDGDSVRATLSTVPPDVNKRVEDINRNLEKQQTVNNPDKPS